MICSFEIVTPVQTDLEVTALVQQTVIALAKQERAALVSFQMDHALQDESQRSVVLRYAVVLDQIETLGREEDNRLKQSLVRALEKSALEASLLSFDSVDRAFSLSPQRVLNKAGFCEVDDDCLEITDF